MTTLLADAPVPAAYPLPVDPRSTPLVGDDARSVVRVRVEAGVVTAGGLWAADGDEVTVLEALRSWSRAAGHRALTVEALAEQTALATALQDATVLSAYMVKPAPATAPALPPGFAVRPMSGAEYETWLATTVDEYVRDDVVRSGGDLDLARRRAEESFARHLPDGAATADTTLTTLTEDGAAVGVLWLRHHHDRYPTGGKDETFTFDVAVDAAHRGRGLGRAAMLAAERAALEVGDRQLGLNVFGSNAVANGLYRSLGYVARTTVFDVPVR